MNFTVHALKSEAEFRRRRAVIHEISHNILVASTQFERPFDYSTSSWVKDNDCRAKNVSKLRAVQRHYSDGDRGQAVTVDIGLVKGDDQYAYLMKSVHNPPYIRFTVPGTTTTTITSLSIDSRLSRFPFLLICLSIFTRTSLRYVTTLRSGLCYRKSVCRL